jgi:hypothetical protein
VPEAGQNIFLRTFNFIFIKIKGRQYSFSVLIVTETQILNSYFEVVQLSKLDFNQCITDFKICTDFTISSVSAEIIEIERLLCILNTLALKKITDWKTK